MEAYIGEYASGKSEVAVNRAINLASNGRRVNLVDLDIVEPCYTLRPIKKKLIAMGINVTAWETREIVGLGETGSILHPANRWALRLPGDVILDIGYGVEGARTLNLVEGAATDPDLKIFAVVNTGRPLTGTVTEIVDYVRSLGKVDGLINNSHLGSETDVDFVQEGARIVDEAARQLGIPVVATTALEELARVIGDRDAAGHPVWPIKRYMPQTLW
ncbi:hypothetical protein [Desulfofundulus sp.]|uniref:hypothetical protein n=1 Tax=Desulfofundulus sp. TaxID=2282750 RepID=UPI003C7063A4